MVPPGACPNGQRPAERDREAVWGRWGCQPLLERLGCARWASAQAGRAIGGCVARGGPADRGPGVESLGPKHLWLVSLLPEAPGGGAGLGRLGPKAAACRLVHCSVLAGGQEHHSPDMAVGLKRAGGLSWDPSQVCQSLGKGPQTGGRGLLTAKKAILSRSESWESMVKEPLGWFLLETQGGHIPSSLRVPGATGLYVPHWVSASEAPRPPAVTFPWVSVT